MKRFRVEKKLENIMLDEAINFRSLLTDVTNYEILKKVALEEPQSVLENELEAAKEAILERWPTITDLDVALESTGPTRKDHMHRLISEAKNLPRVLPTRPPRETRVQRMQRKEEKLTRLKDKAKEKKDKKPK